MMSTLSSSVRRAHEVGDEEAGEAGMRAIKRIADGDDPTTVYSEWLRSQSPP
jgi:hypothetical protein